MQAARGGVKDVSGRVEGGAPGCRHKEFPLDPFRFNGVGREDEDKPVATPERCADLVVPLLRSLNIDFAVPDRNSVAAQDTSQLSHEGSILAGVG